MKFSDNSMEHLSSCHPKLAALFIEVIKHVDCTVICGARTIEQQKEYVRTGKSKTMNSKHLVQADGKSWAVDVMRCPIDWDDWERNREFAMFVRGIAVGFGIKIRSGLDWDSDFDSKDHSFLDAPHFELMGL